MIINIVIVFVFLSYSSCKKQESSNYLPINKVLIIEYNYIINSENDQFIFLIQGFSELEKDFKLSYATYGHNGFYYCNPEAIVPDSIRNKISKILLNYPADTTFLSTREHRIYDGNHYRFFIQKSNKEEISIKFEPEFLPEDLLFLYKYLYDDKQASLSQYGFDGLFKEFEKKVQSDMPSPILTTLPILAKDKDIKNK